MKRKLIKTQRLVSKVFFITLILINVLFFFTDVPVKMLTDMFVWSAALCGGTTLVIEMVNAIRR